MPTYDYEDENKHKTSITVTYVQYANMEKMICLQCGKPMKRVYHVVPVNWNGLPPHEADARPPQIQKFLGEAEERRAKYLDTERKKNAS